MTETDKAALAKAIEIARKDPTRRRRLDDELAKGKDWRRVAGDCACWCQHDALTLMPWQLPPIYYAAHLDSVLREPFGDPSGRREAGEVLKKLLALGLSRFEPDPLGAIAEAEAKRQPAK
jgi:hypothetical protein